jgi:2-oxoglutarate ferredoxin oxidoreductase subunit gamma
MNLLLAGFGGQGVLFTGRVVCYAGMIDGSEVSWMPSYGPEMRGGTCNCSVCVSDEPIGSPVVTEPDVLIAMNAPSFEKFSGAVKPGGIIIMDSSLIELDTDRTDITVYKVPAAQLASENGMHGLSSLILLGKFLEATNFSNDETIRKAVEKSVPVRNKHLVEPNVSAVMLGRKQ